MKPDWKDAPEWAEYLAMDANGKWFWYEFLPENFSLCWAALRGKVQPAYEEKDDWRDSLEQRPEAENGNG